MVFFLFFYSWLPSRYPASSLSLLASGNVCSELYQHSSTVSLSPLPLSPFTLSNWIFFCYLAHSQDLELVNYVFFFCLFVELATSCCHTFPFHSIRFQSIHFATKTDRPNYELINWHWTLNVEKAKSKIFRFERQSSPQATAMFINDLWAGLVARNPQSAHRWRRRIGIGYVTDWSGVEWSIRVAKIPSATKSTFVFCGDLEQIICFCFPIEWFH